MNRPTILTFLLSLSALGISPALAQPAPHRRAGLNEGAFVVTTKLTVRSGASARSTPVGFLAKGASVEVIRINAGWASLMFNGRVRFVKASYLRAGSAEGISTSKVTYHLKGTDSVRGDYTLLVTLVGLPGRGVEITRQATYANGAKEQHRGLGSLEAGELRVRIDEAVGARGILAGEQRGSFEMKLWLGPDGSLETRSRSRRGVGHAKGSSRRAAPPLEAEATSAEPGFAGKILQRGRHLIAIADREVRAQVKKKGKKLAYDGVKFDESFGLGSFFHVGVGGKLRALAPAELSPSQAETSRLEPNHVWIKSNVHGGPRVALSTSIPVGYVSIGLGFSAGARVDYSVTDHYPMPKGVKDVKTALADLRQVAARSFDLPLDAEEARRMTVGAVRVFEGRADIAVSGNLSVGHEVANVYDVLRIGASARVGGFYKISGRARLEVERLPRERVRVRLSRGKKRKRGLTADLLIGATLDGGQASRQLAPAIEYIDEALVDLTKLSPKLRARVIEEAEGAAIKRAKKIIRRVIRIQIKASATQTEDDELDLAFRFDLQRAPAREAYERAIRGDMTRAAKLALDSQSGVVLDHRVLDAETTTHLAASLDLSILSISASRKIRLQDLSVEDESGRTQYEVWRFQRDFKFEVLDHERHKRVDVEMIRKLRHDETGAERVSRSLRFRYEIVDPITRESEAQAFQRLLRAWRLDGGSSLPLPDRGPLLSRYGKTSARVDVQVSERGLASILNRSEGELLAAYTRAYEVIEGEPPIWSTSLGLSKMADADKRHGRPGVRQRDRYKAARFQLKRALRFANQVHRLAGASTAVQRASALKWIANSARYDLYAVAAIVELAPREAISIDASLLGESIQVVDGVRGGTALAIDDPRSR
ncbi:MAG: SH3 domain-containing protein [Planctomycetes bacterium]|nr:SH3 domain-containing protein [Planctomycetota bacterium]